MYRKLYCQSRDSRAHNDRVLASVKKHIARKAGSLRCEPAPPCTTEARASPAPPRTPEGRRSKSPHSPRGRRSKSPKSHSPRGRRSKSPHGSPRGRRSKSPHGSPRGRRSKSPKSHSPRGRRSKSPHGSPRGRRSKSPHGSPRGRRSKSPKSHSPRGRGSKPSTPEAAAAETTRGVCSDVTVVRQPRRYGPPRSKPRPVDRDIAMVEDRLDQETTRQLEELRRLDKEKAEKARLEAERLESLREQIILVESINEHIEDNTTDHHTDLYACTEDDTDPQLVVRRGQEFKLTFTFQRPYDKELDDLYIVFSTGDNPNVHKKTSARIKLREDDRTRYMTGKKRKWGACIHQQADNSLTVNVYSPPDAVVGEWEYSVRTRMGDQEFEYEADQDIVVLLNPWCKDDTVYVEDTKLLDEYIINQVGSVYSGSHKKIRNKPWIYGQFHSGVLTTSLDLLRFANGGAVSARMADPVYISRALSRILNGCDEGGVLTGRWDGKYEDGTPPLRWTGSPSILEEYKETGQPVKYGQCWVFSHLLTTVSRALGLPCRSVTNFSSAHDTDLTMTIDKYMDDEGDEIDYLGGDSVWNFHVWNDVWMRRPDLDKAYGVEGKYDGWQAVDATPQELSAGLYQCGPSPLAAIKLGEVNVSYDTGFVFGEVNSERCTWLNSDPLTLLRRDTHSVGKKMSTKVPDGGGYKTYHSFLDQTDGRSDVTHQYKAQEGSAAEREAVETAVSEGRHGDILTADSTGVELSLVDENFPDAGEDFTLKFTAKNTSDETRTVVLRANVRPSNYWGSLLGKLRIASERYASVALQPGDEKTYDISVKASHYLELCDESLSMRILLLANIDECKDPVVMAEDIVLECPDIDIQGPQSGVSPQDSCDLTVTYFNPAHKELTNVCLKIDGSIYVDNDGFDLKYRVYTKDLGTLPPQHKESLVLKCRPMVKPKHSKQRELTVTLSSKELPDMTGSLSMTLA